MSFPKTPSPESLFSHPAPFSGLPAGGQFLSHPRVRSRIAFLLSKQQTFQEEDFPRGILHSPHIILGNVVTQFRPAFRLSVRCGTQNYTRFERRVNTFCKKFFSIVVRCDPSILAEAHVQGIVFHSGAERKITA